MDQKRTQEKSSQDFNARLEAPGAAFAIVDVVFAALAALYWWLTFSGPFRWSIDLELKFFGNYSEGLTAVGVGIAMYFPIWLCEAILRRCFPSLLRVSVMTLAITWPLVGLAIAGTLFGLVTAWQWWEPPHQVASLQDPIQIVDLDQLGPTAPPTGHVRLVGLVDRTRQTVLRFTGRRGTRGHSEFLAPVIPRHRNDPKAPVRIVAFRSESSEASVAQGVPDDPEGILAPSKIDTSTLYEMKRRGVRLDEPLYALTWPGNASSTSSDSRVASVLLLVGIVGVWGISIVSTIKQSRARRAASAPAGAGAVWGSPPANAAPMPEVSPEPELSKASFWDRISVRALIGWSFVAVVLALIAWNFLVKWALYGIGGGVLVAGGVVWWLFNQFASEVPRSTAPITSTAGPPPLSNQAPTAASPALAQLLVMRDQPTGGASYFKVEVDGTRVAVLKSNQYTLVPLAPGTHRLAVNGRVSLARDTVESFEATSGKDIVFRLHVPFIGAPRLERVTDLELVRATMLRLKYVPYRP